MALVLELKVNGIDRTNDIIADTLQKQDNINEQVDTLRFSTDRFVPVIGESVEMKINGVIEFAGSISEVKKSVQHGRMKLFDVVCSDYTQELNRRLVLERYDNTSVASIIDDIITTYAGDFTTNNVNCSVVLQSMIFNRVSVSNALDKLARETGYSWYVDYEKDIHFFSKNENPAPFGITDTNGNYLQNTLFITDDLSQLRNQVTIRGSEERGEVRSKKHVADGEQITFPTDFKFAEMPTVKVSGSTVTVGVDYLTKEEDADCFWSFQEKYIRFKQNTKPTSSAVVEITGIPLFPVIVKIPDPVSISKYGIYEFFKEDKSIASRDEALKYARAELDAYKDGVIEGSFETDKPGLRSGQLININSDILNVNEDFLIQSVQFRMIAKDKGNWDVKLATARTMGIIQVLQDLIRFREIREFDPENLLSLYDFTDSCGATDLLGATTKSTTKYYFYDPVSSGQPEGFFNLATWDS